MTSVVAEIIPGFTTSDEKEYRRRFLPRSMRDFFSVSRQILRGRFRDHHRGVVFSADSLAENGQRVGLAEGYEAFIVDRDNWNWFRAEKWTEDGADFARDLESSIRRGYVFCAILHEGALAHFSNSFVQTPSTPGPAEFAFLRDDTYMGIGPCVTMESHRGRGLYPAALQILRCRARDQRVERIYINSRPENMASVRGITKAGFIPVATVVGQRRLYCRTFVVWPLRRHL